VRAAKQRAHQAGRLDAIDGAVARIGQAPYDPTVVLLNPLIRTARVRRSLRVRAALALGIGGVLFSCVDLGELAGDDAGAVLPERAEAGDAGSSQLDAALAVPPTGFLLVASPAHVTLDPGESTDVTIRIVRGSAFADSVDVSFQGQGADLLTNPAQVTIPSTATDGTFSLKVDGAATSPKDSLLTLVAVSKRDTSVTANSTLGVRVGSLLLETQTSTTFALPDYATRIVVKVWGAGGGGGGDAVVGGYTRSGSTGGGGGFATATVPVVPTSGPLILTVGTGGAGPTTFHDPQGGGGGGYSSVAQINTALVVAGGGGGGPGGGLGNNNGQCSQPTFATAGAGGGGGDAQPTSGLPNRSATTTAGGAATPDAGSTPGTSLHGGQGGPVGTVVGGLPGGGAGGAGAVTCSNGGGGGGGGGGWFGGAGGARGGYFGQMPESGGGGSGFVIGAATGVTVEAATSPAAAGATDPDYLMQSGRGGPGAVGMAVAVAGTSGRVVVRLSKP
jgi:hypothetical protein